MNILIATDGSADAANALNFMLRFPFPRISRMTVLTVVSDIPMLPQEIDALDASQRQQLAEANQQLLADAEELVERESARLRADGWPVAALVRRGSVVEEILGVADEIKADLIVLGSHGMGLARRFLLGSVSDRVLEHAHCSVLIVKRKPGAAGEAKIEPGTNAAYNIMLAYDTSEVTHAALDLCASLPLQQDSAINVVNVMPLITAYRQDVRQHINDIWQQKKQITQYELEKTVAELQWATPNVKTQLREASNVSDEILNAAEQAGSDLIMFGCKDRSAIRNLLLGSITRRLARYAECTVWAVRIKKY